MMNITKIQAGTQVPGLQDVGTVDNAAVIPSFSIPAPAGTTVTKSFMIKFNRSDVFTLGRLNFAGTTNLGNYWVPLLGTSTLYDTVPGAASVSPYQIQVNIQTVPGGRLVTLTFTNNLSAVPVTVPTITVNYHLHFYSYPW